MILKRQIISVPELTFISFLIVPVKGPEDLDTGKSFTFTLIFAKLAKIENGIKG